MEKINKTVHLVLKTKWWEMIINGIKKEEYRDYKEYYRIRLETTPKPKYVCFHKGYTSTTMTFEITEITIGIGKKEWGAPETNVYILKLGRRI